MSKIGFIGLGIMGTPMALNLQKGGHQLLAYTRRTVPAELVAAGATACESAKAVALAADIIITMVPDTPNVADALFGETGVAAGLTPGKLALDCARSLGMALPNTASTQQLFNACAAQGGSAWDHSAIVRALELMANYTTGKQALDALPASSH